MDVLPVYYLNTSGVKHMGQISMELNSLKRYRIGEMLWVDTPSPPQVEFAIAYTDNSILLKFFVEEPTLVITKQADQSAVHEDSCVEFFISFNNDDSYYNFEFNSIGTCAFGYGHSRSGRLAIPGTGKIERMAKITRCIEKSSSPVCWELSVVIPFELFCYHEISSLTGVRCKANFYKCGDGLPNPHYFSWRKIISHKPDFHQPSFFGIIHFKQPENEGVPGTKLKTL